MSIFHDKLVGFLGPHLSRWNLLRRKPRRWDSDRSLHASWFESGFLIHQSPQTYYRPDFLETTPMLIPPPPSWLSTQNPRTRPRHSAVDRLFASTGTTDFHVTFPLEPLTGHRDINKLSKFSCESMIFVPHDYCLVINLCIMLFPVK